MKVFQLYFLPEIIRFHLEGFKLPAIKLNKVVFPDPLGPIIPVIEPFLILSEHFETAANPPKYLERLFNLQNI